MQTEIETIEQFRLQLGQVIFGTFFTIFGLLTAAIAILRREKGLQILIWLAVWSGIYGIRLLISSSAIQDLLSGPFSNIIPAVDVIISYLVLVAALLTWLYLTRGQLKFYLKSMIIIGSIISIAGIGWYLATGDSNKFMLYNNIIAASTLIVFTIILAVRKLADKYLILHNRGILLVGTLLFITEALYSNLSWLFGYRINPVTGWIGFAILLLSLAYVAAKMIFNNERRLILIESEMETARQIQTSILPEEVPEVNNLRIASAYYPMNAVAGDFYEFIEMNKNEAGFLLADVSGHGVPAALIASMIKIAIQSVRDTAKDPGEILRLLNKILGDQLHGQFVTAAYLYINSENCQARYSAAGHPPLLYWNALSAKAEFIESNGLVFGVLKETEYPVIDFTFNKNDRFLIYSDGLIETKNFSGEEFGDERLSEVIREYHEVPAEELSKIILNELSIWQNNKPSQQDDLTWIIIDCV
jgi:sigma-B regulation protein RsbU (phosphoserine phosphatase)